ncbi:hypothetical protein UlMin_033779 [Ulmus minor]
MFNSILSKLHPRYIKKHKVFCGEQVFIGNLEFILLFYSTSVVSRVFVFNYDFRLFRDYKTNKLSSTLFLFGRSSDFPNRRRREIFCFEHMCHKSTGINRFRSTSLIIAFSINLKQIASLYLSEVLGLKDKIDLSKLINWSEAIEGLPKAVDTNLKRFLCLQLTINLDKLRVISCRPEFTRTQNISTLTRKFRIVFVFVFRVSTRIDSPSKGLWVDDEVKFLSCLYSLNLFYFIFLFKFILCTRVISIFYLTGRSFAYLLLITGFVFVFLFFFKIFYFRLIGLNGQIDMAEAKYPVEHFKTFNEFFVRELKPGARPIACMERDDVAVCAADCRLMAFKTADDSLRFWIKGRKFSIKGLLGQEVCSDAFVNGSLVIFRLAPQDYHRFHVPVSGVVEKFVNIPGCLYTVNPIAVNSKYCNVFTQNKRVVSVISTAHFGKVAFVAIGATMVGSITFLKKEGDHVKKGEEFGYFSFGGSTVICVFEKDSIEIDEDLIANSCRSLETLVAVGMKLGVSKKASNVV